MSGNSIDKSNSTARAPTTAWQEKVLTTATSTAGAPTTAWQVILLTTATAGAPTTAWQVILLTTATAGAPTATMVVLMFQPQYLTGLKASRTDHSAKEKVFTQQYNNICNEAE